MHTKPTMVMIVMVFQAKKRQGRSGQSFHIGLTLVDLSVMFPDEAMVEAWIAEVRWPEVASCAHRESSNVRCGSKHPSLPLRCRSFRKFFSRCVPEQ